VFEFAEVESARAAIKRFFKPGDLVLLKASRATRLERVANVLRLPDEKRVECFTS
jgi:UDP-N-acetylmuramyl pentapeptide synthase